MKYKHSFKFFKNGYAQQPNLITCSFNIIFLQHTKKVILSTYLVISKYLCRLDNQTGHPNTYQKMYRLPKNVQKRKTVTSLHLHKSRYIFRSYKKLKIKNVAVFAIFQKEQHISNQKEEIALLQIAYILLSRK